MSYPPEQYLANVLEQPKILQSLVNCHQELEWSETLQDLWQPLRGLPVLLTGMGASDSALWPLWFHLNQHGILAQKVTASELIHYLPNLLARPGLCIVVSQSGESIEIQRLAEQIHNHRSQGQSTPTLVSLTTTSNNSLSRESDLALYTEAGAEVGVATKTFTSTMGLLHLIGRCLTNQLTPATFEELTRVAAAQELLLQNWQQWMSPALEALSEVKSYALVGRGPSQAAVYDGALVLQEAVRRMAHGFSGGDFRHGPMEMLGPDLGVLLFNTPGGTLQLSQRLGQDVAQRGGTLVTVGPAETVPAVHVPLPACSDMLMPMLEILPVQLLAHHVAGTLGLVPGNFQWSGKVILHE